MIFPLVRNACIAQQLCHGFIQSGDPVTAVSCQHGGEAADQSEYAAKAAAAYKEAVEKLVNDKVFPDGREHRVC